MFLEDIEIFEEKQSDGGSDEVILDTLSLESDLTAADELGICSCKNVLHCVDVDIFLTCCFFFIFPNFSLGAQSLTSEQDQGQNATETSERETPGSAVAALRMRRVRAQTDPTVP